MLHYLQADNCSDAQHNSRLGSLLKLLVWYGQQRTFSDLFVVTYLMHVYHFMHTY